MEAENVSLLDGVLSNGCNAESKTNRNEPFKVCIVDEEGVVLEAFVQENGVIKPYIPQNNKPKTRVPNKKSIKKTRTRQISPETKKILKKNHNKKHFKLDEALKNKLYSCKLCDSEFMGRKPYRQHLHQHIKIEDNRLICCFCQYTSPYRGHLHRHILRRHYHFKREKSFTCNTCGKSFFDRKDLERHKFVHTQKGNLKCSFCDFSHVRKRTFEKHMKLCHAMSIPVESHDLCECDYCGYKCRDKRDITTHI